MPKGTMLVSRTFKITNTTLRMDDAHLRALHCKYWLWGHNHRAMPEQAMQSPVVLGVDTTSLNPSGTSMTMRCDRIWWFPTSEPSLLTTHVVRGQCIFLQCTVHIPVNWITHGPYFPHLCNWETTALCGPVVDLCPLITH